MNSIADYTHFYSVKTLTDKLLYSYTVLFQMECKLRTYACLPACQASVRFI